MGILNKYGDPDMDLWCPLKEDERKELRNGGVVTKTFHTSHLYFMVIHMNALSKKEIEERYKVIVESGDNVINVPIGEESMDKIESHKEALKSGYKNNMTVIVLSQEMFNELETCRDSR